MQPVKILKFAYLTHYARIPSPDADSICVMQTCAELAKLDNDITLIIPDNQGLSLTESSDRSKVWELYTVPINFKIKFLPAKLLYKLGYPGRTVYKLAAFLYAIAAGYKVFFTRQLETAWLAAMIGKVTILSEHVTRSLAGKIIFPHFVKILNNPKKPVGMITVTKSGENFLINSGVPKERLLVAPMAVDLAPYSDKDNGKILKKSLNLSANKKIVGFSGNLYPGRGVEELIEAAKFHPTLVFFIVGGYDEDIRRCKNFSDSLAISNVQFIGHILHDEVPQYLLASDILIMPYTSQTSTYEDMSPMKMFEYMAAGRPIVATDFPVIREILTDKKNAILVPPDSAADIAAGIQWILDHPQKAMQFANQARLDVENHTWGGRAHRINSWILNTFGGFTENDQ